ncbi:phosphate signaling complex protein PhoU [Leucobacter luti]|uniref:Phosphate-specific transport system accessory protein PhoU n=1 Tax=Leucobacter luti TaxID=340320 RepID=A0A4V3CYU5_9MICO|nr:phosphate signaling complex protein PhoU [Leucobacter luti]MCW2288845.1 phosphate transport system protein [Leucobacter luti]QYM75257.1 phosphate signaling complex protein PhoU [Leucobacter luti]TCK45004.1 PhoU-like phosphate uptake regulator [Leucobacter luti]TDP95528.1 PhoU-like phosphate uptake regulator [Leucobacter luti]
MREVFQQSLREVQDRLVKIAELVEEAIENATSAFGNSDVAIAERVIDGVEEIETRAAELDQHAIDILARQQPVASDLRLVVGALRMSSSLERMADLAQHIAQLARYRYPESAIPKGLSKTFVRMAALDVEMAAKLVELLRTQEPSVIAEIRDLDDDLDELHAKVFEKVLSDKLADNPTGVVDATLASRYHERFGDHAVSVAKQMQFFLSGTVDLD